MAGLQTFLKSRMSAQSYLLPDCPHCLGVTRTFANRLLANVAYRHGSVPTLNDNRASRIIFLIALDIITASREGGISVFGPNEA